MATAKHGECRRAITVLTVPGSCCFGCLPLAALIYATARGARPLAAPPAMPARLACTPAAAAAAVQLSRTAFAASVNWIHLLTAPGRPTISLYGGAMP